MIYLAAICIQQMPVKISLGLWTISMMEKQMKADMEEQRFFLHYIDSSNQEQGGVRDYHVLRVFCAHILSPVHTV